MMTLNSDQQLYVLRAGDAGYTTLGYEHALHETNHIARLLTDASLETDLQTVGTESGFEAYQRAVRAWCAQQAGETYYAHGTSPAVVTILERLRNNRQAVRLFYGDPDSGRDWCQTNDVTGRIARSMGPMKIPLLIPGKESGGGAILCPNLLKISDLDSNKTLYVAPNYTAPTLEIATITGKNNHPHRVRRNGEEIAGFRTLGEAHSFAAFVLGAGRYNGD